MHVVEVSDKKIWNSFVSSQPHSQFLQSFEWGEFQESLGRKCWRFFATDSGATMGAIQVFKYPLPFNKNILYAPRGPVKSSQFSIFHFPRLLSAVTGKMEELAKRERSIFFRFEPPLVATDFFRQVITTACHEASSRQPRDTILLDLAKSEDELLKEMHQKTRYNIRLAERSGVEITDGDFPNFWKIMELTARRDNFHTHPKDYYEKMLRAMGGKTRPGAFLRIIAAKYQGETIAANIVAGFGDTATYVHGASSNAHRNLMAPHLLQWFAIREAKRAGFKYYDLYGIAPSGSPENHPWAGITRFKRGFGGEEINFAGTFEVPFNKFWYALYRMSRKLK